MLRRSLTALVAFILAAAALVGVQGPADAGGRSGGPGAVYDQGRYNDTYEFEDEECGIGFVGQGRNKGFFTIYVAEGSNGQAFLIDDHYSYSEVLTNPANGKKMFISGHGRFRELTATHVEGNVFEFIVVDVGTPFVVKDGRGRTVLKDRGKATFRQVFDTLGDSQPGGNELEFEVVSTKGRFPSLSPDFDFCALVSRLIG
jgi:hypothetical protein